MKFKITLGMVKWTFWTLLVVMCLAAITCLSKAIDERDRATLATRCEALQSQPKAEVPK